MPGTILNWPKALKKICPNILRGGGVQGRWGGGVEPQGGVSKGVDFVALPTATPKGCWIAPPVERGVWYWGLQSAPIPTAPPTHPMTNLTERARHKTWAAPAPPSACRMRDRPQGAPQRYTQ